MIANMDIRQKDTSAIFLLKKSFYTSLLFKQDRPAEFQQPGLI